MLPAIMVGRILAVGNLKSGTGKTTVAVNLACSLVGPRRAVVLVDADSLKGGTGKTTVAFDLGCSLASPRREVVLIDADGQGTATAWGAAGDLPVEVIPLPLDGERGRDRWVAAVLAQAAAVDVLVLDLPPHLAGPTALAIAEVILIPVTPSGADLIATQRAVELVR